MARSGLATRTGLAGGAGRRGEAAARPALRSTDGRPQLVRQRQHVLAHPNRASPSTRTGRAIVARMNSHWLSRVVPPPVNP
jgi:hypothetical protein